MRSLARRMGVVESIAYAAKFGAGASSLPSNTALQVPDWFIDPQNSTGKASDSNSGQSAVAPLATLRQLTALLGTEEPDFGPAAIVNIHMLSSTNQSDPLRM